MQPAAEVGSLVQVVVAAPLGPFAPRGAREERETREERIPVDPANRQLCMAGAASAAAATQTAEDGGCGCTTDLGFGALPQGVHSTGRRVAERPSSLSASPVPQLVVLLGELQQS